MTPEAIRRFAVASTKASSKLEGRALPPEYVRSAKVERFLANLRFIDETP